MIWSRLLYFQGGVLGEEYVIEGIRWTPVDYFNNQIVCELIEETKPPGVFAILNDVCATLHNVTANADNDLQKKLGKEVSGHQHFQTTVEGFVIHHYAGIVSYNVEGFCDHNRDVLFPDLIVMMQSSGSNFIRSLFPEQMENKSSTRPTTVGTKIKSQASQLVASLMKCSPHYIRCIKPNETKRPRDWEEERVRHQVEYLGLKENVRVRRAGFAYRRVFQKFLQRYAILCNETWPAWRGQPQEGIERIMAASYIERDQYQLGKTKIFIKAPESLFQLEELRERKFDGYARIIQRAFHKYFDKRQRQRQQEQASAIVFGKKQRRKYSINRVFVGDYIGLDHRPELLSLVGRREKVEFCESGAKRDLFITTHRVLLIGREKLKQGPQKGLIVPVIKRDIQYSDIIKVSLSTRQDDLLILHIRGTYDSVVESTFKTEFLTVLSKKYKAVTQQDLPITFSDSMEFTVKKQGWGGGGTRKIRVVVGNSDLAVLKISGKILTMEIGEGLAKNTYPRALDNDFVSQAQRRPVKPARGPGVIPISSSQNRPPHHQQQYNMHSNSNATHIGQNFQNRNSNSSGGVRPPTLRQPPPPPSEPAPPNQPRIPAGAFRLPTTTASSNSNTNGNNVQRFNPVVNKASNPSVQNGSTNNFQTRNATSTGNGIAQKMNQLQANFNPQQTMADILKTPNAGASGAKRTSLSKPAPGAGRPKPKPKPVVKLPKCTALYDYEARDIDELGLKEGDLLEIVKEHDSGWWLGKLRGKEGLFPSNYVEKL
ncbi:Unconventional myosin-Ie [Folsomia candida]|uniref:Unconventional myosin-Ie n=1 Tax=Folsomia candida TaxID=158441 RepID=A0A226F5H6_FOLCA|nr:Unconventional myosin-Ie [Folsomia candida]